MRPGNKVIIEFVSFLDDGTVIEDSSRLGKPFIFELGSGQLFPYLERAITEMIVGEIKEIVLVPEDAYGPVRKELIQTMPLQSVAGDQPLEVGMQITLRVDTERVVPARVIKIAGDLVTLDMNHPLAGKAIHYKIKLLAVE